MLLLDRPIMLRQYWDIRSHVNADYVKEDVSHPGTPRFNFTLTIKVSVRRVFYDHTKSEKMRDTTERCEGLEGGGRWRRQKHEFKENQKKDRKSRGKEECEFFLSCSYHDFHLLLSLWSATQDRGYLSINQQPNRSRSVVSLLSSEGWMCFKTHFFFCLFYAGILDKGEYVRERESVWKKYTFTSERIKTTQ